MQNLSKRRDALVGHWGEVGTSIKRSSFWSEECREWPSASTSHSLHRLHIDLVDVGTLFPIHLHVHEEVIHHCSHRGVLEGLALHHVAPVTGRVSDREQDRFVLCMCKRGCLFPPRVPVNGIVGVLQEVGAGLFC